MSDVKVAKQVLSKAVESAFARHTAFPWRTGLSDFAMRDQQGIEAGKPKFPFILEFRPSATLLERCENTGFSKHSEQSKYGSLREQLSQVGRAAPSSCFVTFTAPSKIRCSNTH